MEPLNNEPEVVFLNQLSPTDADELRQWLQKKGYASPQSFSQYVVTREKGEAGVYNAIVVFASSEADAIDRVAFLWHVKNKSELKISDRAAWSDTFLFYMFADDMPKYYEIDFRQIVSRRGLIESTVGNSSQITIFKADL